MWGSALVTKLPVLVYLGALGLVAGGLLVVLVLLTAHGTAVEELAEPQALTAPVEPVACARAACAALPVPLGQRSWEAGKVVHVWRRVCFGRPNIIRVVRWFENPTTHHAMPDLMESPYKVPPGCYSATFAVEIPPGLYPGEYTFRSRLTRQVNPLKTTIQDLKPLTITVTANSMTLMLQSLHETLTWLRTQMETMQYAPRRPK